MAKSKVAVVIAGMHRSGTSAFSRTVSLLGCDLPTTLMKPAAVNERGYWESSAIAAINNAILQSIGSPWDDPAPIDPAWYRTPVAGDFRARALDLLQGEFGDSRLFVMKDPRICRMLPFWLEVLEAFGAAPAVICPIRNPLEVIASLEARDGMAPWVGFRLWLRHVLDAEYASRGCRRVFVRYADLLAKWDAVAVRLAEQLEISWPADARIAAPAIRDFLSSDLRHRVQDDGSAISDERVPAPVRRTFEILKRWTDDDVRPGDRDELDRLKAALDHSGTLYPAPAASAPGTPVSSGTPRGVAPKKPRKPLLSIAIPAYDRPRELEYALLKFIAQAVLDYGDLIEIIVTDDASPGDTLRGVRERTSIYPFVHFDWNAPNIGLERNLIRSTKYCSGEYLWLFGDDDFLEDANALDEIMSHLSDGRHDFYVLNRTRRSFPLDNVISMNWMELDPAKTFEFPGLREFCLVHGFIAVIGFISVNIFRREPFAAIDPRPYFGTMYPQLGMMVEAFHDRPTLLIGKPLICHRTQTPEEKRTALGGKETEANFMTDARRRNALYFSHPLARMLDHLLDVGAFRPDDIAKIPESVFRKPLIDLLMNSVQESKIYAESFSAVDWAVTRCFFDRIALDPEKRAESGTILDAETSVVARHA